MGRPLNKKYFGNTNLGSPSTSADDTLNGYSVGSYIVDTPGDYLGGAKPTITVGAVDIVGGVVATGTTVMTALATTAVTNGGTNYVVGDLLTVTVGSNTAVFAVDTELAGVIQTITLVDGGVFPTTSGGAKATTTNSLAGAGATLTLHYGILSITPTEVGSGYTSAPAVTVSAGAGAVTAVLYRAGPGSITISAFVPAVNGGSSAVAGDIVRQVNTRSYKVTTAQGTGVCKLVAAAPTAGQMTIIATDANGSTYYVTKLTSRKATLTQNVVNGSFLFATDATAQWGFSAAAGLVVQIANS
jgi:hypothetical protein